MNNYIFLDHIHLRKENLTETPFQLKGLCSLMSLCKSNVRMMGREEIVGRHKQ